MYVHSYTEKGTTTTPFDMVVLNSMDRFHLVGDVIDRVPGLETRTAYAKQFLRDKLLDHKAYINKYGKDMPEIRNWKWSRRNGAHERERRTASLQQCTSNVTVDARIRLPTRAVAVSTLTATGSDSRRLPSLKTVRVAAAREPAASVTRCPRPNSVPLKRYGNMTSHIAPSPMPNVVKLRPLTIWSKVCAMRQRGEGWATGVSACAIVFGGSSE